MLVHVTLDFGFNKCNRLNSSCNAENQVLFAVGKTKTVS